MFYGYETGISKAPGSGMFLSQLSSWSILCSYTFLGIMELLMRDCMSDVYYEWSTILPRFRLFSGSFKYTEGCFDEDSTTHAFQGSRSLFGTLFLT